MNVQEGQPWLSGKVNRKLNNSSNQSNGKQENEMVRGNKWDRVGLKEILDKEHKKLLQGESKYQEISLVEAKDLRMYLDNQLQFSSLDERIYHEAFVHIPMAAAKNRKKVLILGGGDGLALREVLKYQEVKLVDLVDLDEAVLKAARYVPELASLNNRAFEDERVRAYAMDALEFLRINKKIYDVIIVDFPDPSDAILAELYTVEVFRRIYRYLDSDGILVCQSNAIDETPTVFWSIGQTMESAGFYSVGYHTIVPSFGDWGFQMASKKRLKNQVNSLKVASCQTFPSNLEELFTFSDKILKAKRNAEVNQRSNLVLHHIFQKEIQY